MPYCHFLQGKTCAQCGCVLVYVGLPYGQWRCACYPDGIADLNLMVGMWPIPASWRGNIMSSRPIYWTMAAGNEGEGA